VRESGRRDRRPCALLLRSAFDGSTVPACPRAGGRGALKSAPGRDGRLSAGRRRAPRSIALQNLGPAASRRTGGHAGPGALRHLLGPRGSGKKLGRYRQATEDPGYNFETVWLFARHANPALALHDAVLRQASFIAVTMIAVALAGLAVIGSAATLPVREDSAFGAGGFPWPPSPSRCSFSCSPSPGRCGTCSRRCPSCQYPWRWLEAMEAPMAIFFAAAVWPAGRRARAAVLGRVYCGLSGGHGVRGNRFLPGLLPRGHGSLLLAAYRSGAGFEGMYEYEPPGADITLIATGLPDACLVSDPATELGKADPDDPDNNPTWSPSSRLPGHFHLREQRQHESGTSAHSRCNSAGRPTWCCACSAIRRGACA